MLLICLAGEWLDLPAERISPTKPLIPSGTMYLQENTNSIVVGHAVEDTR